MEISFPTDNDGFLSQECPSCSQKFKVVFGEGSDKPNSFCPYCGYECLDCWWTQEQVNYIQGVALNTVVVPELTKLAQKLNQSSSSSLKMELNSDISKTVHAPIDLDDDFEIFKFTCCNETVKATRRRKMFCIICGKEIDLVMSEAKKVFLSHKGIDKDLVRDFSNTLHATGYESWLDEDAMPAGTALERGLLQGMQQSCGVVFFITPSFRDEGFLETEINYAIQQKREKGEKFSIITLQFVDENRNVGEIPDLLKTYVWKKPKTHLEALKEIIRALPVTVKHIDWRDDIDDVVVTSNIKSKTTELSEEAKTILREAVAGDGTIMHIHFMSGEELSTNGKSLIPDRNARTIAKWTGGLEDLIRRRYVKDVGHKREIFEVTREGYEAADEL